MECKLVFDTLNRGRWINVISGAVNEVIMNRYDRLILDFDSISDVSKFQAIHLASLACLIEHYHKAGVIVATNSSETEMGKFLFKTLQMQKYWVDRKNYTEAEDDKVLNLWRIKDDEKEVHSQRVHDYLKRKYFQNKDLSVVKGSLDEAYYNIFDHAEADGNAFSFIKYDETTQKLSVAVCDFGMGIAAKVRRYIPEIATDHDAITKAVEFGFTTNSRTHNGGKGLDNIRMACTDDDALRIISNDGFLYANRGQIHSRNVNYGFHGTLIYYELSLSHFENEEIIDTFGF